MTRFPTRNVLVVGIAAALLAGCGLPQPPIATPGTQAFNHAAHTDRGKSGLRPPRYIYVTNQVQSGSGWASSVTVYPVYRSGNVPPSSVIAGSRTQLTAVNGIVVSDNGEIYVAVSDTDEIVGFHRGAAGDAAPNVVIAGSNTLLRSPIGLALDANGNLYVGCRTPAVLEFKAGSNWNVAPVRDITGSQTELGDANDPALDRAGNIYVANTTAPYTIDVFSADADGNVKPVRVIAGSRTQLDQPDGIALSSLSLYAGASLGYYLERFRRTAKGNTPPLSIIGGNKTRLGNVDGIALDDFGVLYAASPNNSSIIEFPSSAHGNVRPFRKIVGSRTQLDYPVWVFAR